MRLLLSWGWLALACCLCSAPAGAQTVILHLRNGDRITGRLLSESTNAVILATAFAKNVSIAKSLVDRREEISGELTNAPPASTNQQATGVASELVLTNKATMTQAAGGAKLPETKAKPAETNLFRRFLSEWRGEAQVGANVGYSTINRSAFTGHAKLANNHKFPAADRDMRNILEYNFTYGTTGDVLSDNRMDGSWKLEYDLNKRFYLYNAAAAGYDQIQDINLQYDVGPGVGYKWVVLTNFVFKTELGGDYQEQYFTQNRQTSVYSLRLAEDLWWQITRKIRWDEKVEFFPRVDDFTDYRVRLESNLSYLLKENLTLSLNVIELYNTTVPTGVSQNDLQVRSLLGIKF